jgi:hypothetical protein
MVPGQLYHIVSTPIQGVWNKPREMIFRFVAEDEDSYIFSARPEAGTQDMLKNQVAEIHPAAADAKIMLPRIYRGEGR